VVPEAPGPAEQVIVEEEHAQIRSALTSLSTRDRELLWLSEVEGLTYAEVGGRIGAATGTTRVACHRARRRLEEAYLSESERQRA
jgi:RNA polymerase sigma factor (sigma-70 family)